MRKVLVTCKQMQDSLPLLIEDSNKDFDFVLPELKGQSFKAEEMVRLLRGVDYLIAGDDELTSEVLHSSKLKFLCKWGVGLDNVDMVAAEASGIEVTNTPGLFGDDVADLAMAYLLSMLRNIKSVDKNVRNGHWPRVMSRSLSSMNVLVYGFGSIGEAVSLRLQASRAAVTVVEPDSIRAPAASINGFEVVQGLDFEEGKFDALIVAVPLTEKTRKSVDCRVISRLRAGSFLVNVSRGAVVAETDVIEKLKTKHLAGFASDVFEIEPLEMSHEFIEMDEITWLGSHNASNAERSVLEASRQALSKLTEFQEKRKVV